MDDVLQKGDRTMAQMYPDKPRPETKSPAEKDLFTRFQSQLSDEWVVFHSVSWLASNQKGYQRDCETDFVIAHPNLGILVLEVKGGEIRFDLQTQSFTSTDGRGNVHEIGDPFEQATDSMHSLLRFLKGKSRWPLGYVIFGRAVAFPDSVVEDDVRPDGPKEILLDYTHLQNLEAWLTDIMSFYQANAANRNLVPGSVWLRILTNLLTQSSSIRNPLLGDKTETHLQIIHELTEQQYQVLTGLSGYRRAVIHGCPGSGKTVLALEKARQLAEEDGCRVLYVCYNNRLAEQLTPQKSFEVSTYQNLCESLALKAGIDIASDHRRKSADLSIRDEYFNSVLPEALFDAAEKLGPQFDAIVVDEAQDFNEYYWDSIVWLLHPQPERGILYIFIDEHQAVFTEGQRRALPIKDPSYLLSRNIRNTHAVFNLFHKFYPGNDPISCAGPEGGGISVKTYSSEKEMSDQILQAVSDYRKQEKMDLADIAILTPRYTSKHSNLPGPPSILRDQQLGTYKLVAGTPSGKMELDFSSIYRYKGLESSVVILCEVDEQIPEKDLRVLLYTGISRARSHVTVLAKDSLSPAILEELSCP